MTFQQKLDTVVSKNNSLVCVGLDSDYEKIPASLKRAESPVYEFNKAIIDATADLVCAYKPNPAFYEAQGAFGVEQLKMTCDYIRLRHPEVALIIDAKRGDIANTNRAYAKYVFDYLGGDAVTLHPYLGKEALQPFLDYAEKGCIILCRTSNPGAGEFQDLLINGERLYAHVACRVVEEWNANGNCLLMVGATYPKELAEIRAIAGEVPILVAGIDTQGGAVEEVLKDGLNAQKAGLIINASRSIIFSSGGEDFVQVARGKARHLREEVNRYR